MAISQDKPRAELDTTSPLPITQNLDNFTTIRLSAMAITGDTSTATTPCNSSDAVDTPTRITDSDASLSCASFTTKDGTKNIPVPGKAFMIRDFHTGEAITMEEGGLILKPAGGTRGGWHWHCVERDGGWLGFREAVSGNHLGRDDEGGFQAKFKHFEVWESFCLRPLEAGGYHLLVIYESSFRRMGIAGDGGKLIQVKAAAEATRWEFVQV
ncbi:hypothetical protein F4825DRAFT_472851 [Nemania diffusa]|nr:hypothetical protein F4825DRAFT_472851 [Nemania diffusa]